MGKKVTSKYLCSAGVVVIFAIYVVSFSRTEFTNSQSRVFNRLENIKHRFKEIATNKVIRNTLELDMYGTVEELITAFALSDEVTAFKVLSDRKQIISWGQNSTLFFEAFGNSPKLTSTFHQIEVPINHDSFIVVFIDPTALTNASFLKVQNYNGNLIFAFSFVDFTKEYSFHLILVFISITLTLAALTYAVNYHHELQLDRKIKAQKIHDLKNETTFLMLISHKLKLIKDKSELLTIANHINDVIEFKNIVLDKKTPEYVSFNLKEAITDVVNYISTFSFIDSVYLKLSDVRVYGDPDFLKRCLYNLLMNAIHEVNEKQYNVYVSVLESPDTAYVSISNPGFLKQKMIKRGISQHDSSGEGLGIAYDAASKANVKLNFSNLNGNVNFKLELPKCEEKSI